MKRTILLLLTALALVVTSATARDARAFEEFQLWPALAPGETEDAVKPTYEYWKPAEKTTDACLIVAPGGAYNVLAYGHEGDLIAKYFNSKGVTVVVLKYRVPRRKGLPKHMAAWQDAQRMVRVVRSRAKEWDINPDKIGFLGFSAGGHLTLMTATTSQTPAGNAGKGNDSTMVDDFAFDEKTPPMCLIHGDADYVSPMGSVAVYSKLRKMNIPAEMHIFAKVEHGFGGNPKDNHVGNWLDRVYYWMVKLGF